MRKTLPPSTASATNNRAHGVRSLADLLPAVGDTAFRKFGFVQSALLTRWPEIVGDRLARVSQPESLRFAKGTKAEGTLRLTVTSAAAPMVQHLTGDLIASVNRFFGYRAVARIHLAQGVVSRAAPKRVDAASHVPVKEPKAPAPELRAIADPELRAVLEGLATSLAARPAIPKVS